MSEKVEEKQGQAKATPSPAPGPRPEVSERIVRAWVVLASFCWGATLAFLLSPLMGEETVRVGRLVRVSAGGLVAGALLAGLLIALALKKFGARFSYLRPGQARGVRWSAFLLTGLLVASGSIAFYRSVVPTASRWWADIASLNLSGKMLLLKPVLFPSAALFLTVMLAAYLLANTPRAADFLVETEGELKKVSWPARKEYVGSSIVVILVVAVISCYLFFMDELLSFVMHKVGFGF
jgi:preprotein translocase SecE subunit